MVSGRETERPAGDVTQPTEDVMLAQAAALRSLARRFLRDEAAADDLVHETWVAALEHPPATTVRLGDWLATVLQNRAARQRRADTRARRREVEAARTER
jgi:DNA-directed RNA polymerase specialized sigma24 family protein